MSMVDLPDGYRVDWWAVISKLSRAGFGLLAISRKTGIPKSTIIGYKNSNVEPKHQDGLNLLKMHREFCDGEVPLQKGSVRNRMRSVGINEPNENQLWLWLDSREPDQQAEEHSPP